jgi:hypothetical protein
VLRQIRLAQPQTVFEMADTGFAVLDQGFDDLQADGMPERLEDAGALAKGVSSFVFHIQFLEYGHRRPPDSDRCHPPSGPFARAVGPGRRAPNAKPGRTRPRPG